MGDPVGLFAVFAEHLVQNDRVPARKALFDGDEVFPGPAAKAKLLDEIQVRQNAALHDRLPCDVNPPPGAGCESASRAEIPELYR